MLTTKIIDAGYCKQIAYIANNKKPFKIIKFLDFPSIFAYIVINNKKLYNKNIRLLHQI